MKWPEFSDADFKHSSDIDMSDVLKNIKSLYEYNVFLREKLLSTQSEVRALSAKSAPWTERQTKRREHVHLVSKQFTSDTAVPRFSAK